jgi:hypothetical protein
MGLFAIVGIYGGFRARRKPSAILVIPAVTWAMTSAIFFLSSTRHGEDVQAGIVGALAAVASLMFMSAAARK